MSGNEYESSYIYRVSICVQNFKPLYILIAVIVRQRYREKERREILSENFTDIKIDTYFSLTNTRKIFKYCVGFNGF
jgi:hypothetical protein